eukprot:m.258405 g.258405  ORF g.258405 m.258405 type:complete len:287 (-) comp36539_c0_seq1:194-1054(-)
MSSFKKAIKARRKTHKERSQPAARGRLGLLEKGKDWKKRRDDYHFKERRIKAMYEKARNRNPDEFYFGMIKSKTKDGIHDAKRDIVGYTMDEMQLLRSQDLGYINLKIVQEQNQVERLKSSLHLLLDTPEDVADDNMDDGYDNDDFDFDDEPSLSKTPSVAKKSHIVFVDSKAKVAKFDAVKHFDTAPELMGRAYNRPRLETLRSQAVVGSTDAKSIRNMNLQREKAYEQLQKRIARIDQLRKVASGMQTKQNLVGKGKRTKLAPKALPDGQNQPAAYKWKKQRKS